MTQAQKKDLHPSWVQVCLDMIGRNGVEGIVHDSSSYADYRYDIFTSVQSDCESWANLIEAATGAVTNIAIGTSNKERICRKTGMSGTKPCIFIDPLICSEEHRIQLSTSEGCTKIVNNILNV